MLTRDQAEQLKLDIQREFPHLSATVRGYSGASGWVLLVHDPSTNTRMDIERTDENWREKIAQELSPSKRP